MLDDILKNLSDSYTADLLSAQEELDMVSTRLKEERKFLKMLLADEGESFNEFSPRSDSADGGKISETRLTIDDLEKKQSELNISIDLSRQKLSDLRAGREELMKLREEDSLQKKIREDSESAARAEYRELVFKLKNITSFLPADPHRARIELLDLLKKRKDEGDGPSSADPDGISHPAPLPQTAESDLPSADPAAKSDHVPENQTAEADSASAAANETDSFPSDQSAEKDSFSAYDADELVSSPFDQTADTASASSDDAADI